MGVATLPHLVSACPWFAGGRLQCHGQQPTPERHSVSDRQWGGALCPQVCALCPMPTSHAACKCVARWPPSPPPPLLFSLLLLLPLTPFPTSTLPSVPSLSVCLPAPFPPHTPTLCPLPLTCSSSDASRLCFPGEDRFEVKKCYEEMSSGLGNIRFLVPLNKNPFFPRTVSFSSIYIISEVL